MKKDNSKIKQIADSLGLSVATVSVVLNGRGDSVRISKKTQKKVWDEAKKFNYTPNIYARRLRTGVGSDNTYVIAAFWNVTYYLNEMFAALTRAVMEQEEEKGINIELVVVPYTSGMISEEAYKISSNRYSGVLVFGPSGNDTEFFKENEFNIPVIFCNRRIDGYSSVIIDDFLAGEMCAMHFHERGIKTAGLLGVDPDNAAATHRCQGFLEKAKELDISVKKSWIVSDNSRNTSSGYSSMNRMLDSSSYPEGLYVMYDTVIVGVLRSMKEHGLKSPDDIEIVSYGDNVVLHYLTPTITTIRVPTTQLVLSMLSLLISVLEGKKTATIIKEDPSMVYRESSPSPQ
ncbi:MAG: LacI family transcriptional regulator [Butyrivibrio sp.]|nr:LacI family transcriptional regulator [Butyrivibrio sp.]